MAALPAAFVTAQTRMVDASEIAATESIYVNNRAPLPAAPFVKLPVASIEPRGWLGEMLRRQREGLAGRLGEISAWLQNGLYRRTFTTPTFSPLAIR